jgi:hypothetical protein
MKKLKFPIYFIVSLLSQKVAAITSASVLCRDAMHCVSTYYRFCEFNAL